MVKIIQSTDGAWWKYALDNRVALHYFRKNLNVSLCGKHYKDTIYWYLPDYSDVKWRTIKPCSECMRELSKTVHDWNYSQHQLDLLSLCQKGGNEKDIKLLDKFNEEQKC